MAALSEHLTRPEQHARLRFRADCPFCVGERLLGDPPADQLISPRVPAALAAGVLAMSTTAPAVATAAESDQQIEGTAAPHDVVHGDGAQSPDFDPGGQATALPEDHGSVPASRESTEAQEDAPEREPAADVQQTVVDEGEETAPTDAPVPREGQERQAPSPEASLGPATGPPAAESVAPAAPSSVPPGTLIAPTPSPASPRLAPEATPRIDRDIQPGPVRRRVRKTFERRAGQWAAVRQLVAARVTGFTVAQAQSATTGDSSSAKRTARWHVVRPGESLWVIGSSLLGYDPRTEDSDQVADIEAEVDRLWRLNRTRLRSGNPSLIYPGERLRLT